MICLLLLMYTGRNTSQTDIHILATLYSGQEGKKVQNYKAPKVCAHYVPPSKFKR